MKEFVAYLVKNLVLHPDAVDVQVVDGESETLVEIHVSPEDVARVVGREGRTIKSLRILATNVGARFGRKVNLEITNEKLPAEKPAHV